MGKNPNRLLLMYSVESSGKDVYSVRCTETPCEELMNLDPPFRHSRCKEVKSMMNPDSPPIRVWSNYVKLVGSCNGLLCLSEKIRYPHISIYLWNPSVNECRSFPVPADPDNRNVYLAFGFDALNDDYKVLKIGYICREREVLGFEVEVYSLRRDSWKKIGHNSASLTTNYLYYSDQVLVNVSPHWIVDTQSWSTNIRISFPPLIVSFDIADEVFREMSLPDSEHASLRYMCLGFVEGCLSTGSRIPCQNCEVWVMEYGVVQSWTKQYIITEKMVNRPLGLLDSGELLRRKWNGSLILFNPKRRKVEDFGISMGLFSFQVVTYMESLVSVMPDEQSN